MKLVGLCDFYFLIMMVVLCGSSIFIESKSLYKDGDKIASRKASSIGVIVLIVSSILFMLRVVFM